MLGSNGFDCHWLLSFIFLLWVGVQFPYSGYKLVCEVKMNDNNKKLKETTNPVGSILFGWLDHRHSTRIIIGTLSVSCFVLLLVDFVYHRHGHFMIEEVPGFFALYGFLMFSLIILGATTLRYFVKRREDYYGTKAVDSDMTENKK